MAKAVALLLASTPTTFAPHQFLQQLINVAQTITMRLKLKRMLRLWGQVRVRVRVRVSDRVGVRVRVRVQG